MITILAVAFVFGLVMVVHELGHFLAARASGMRVYEFSIGIGPKILSIKRNGTIYSLRPVPFFAFVNIAGMLPDEVDMEDGFAKKSLVKKLATIAAGPVANVLLAIVLLTVFFMGKGVSVPTTVIESVTPGMPAAVAGLQGGDKVLAVDGQPVSDWQQIRTAIIGHPDMPLTFTVERAGSSLDVSVIPHVTADSQGRPVVGIVQALEQQRLGLLPAIGAGFRETWAMITGLVETLLLWVTRRSPSGVDVVGPIGISRVIGESARMGFYYVLSLTAMISANLGIFNLLPVPALDGSRLVFLGIEGVRGRRIDPEMESRVHTIGLGLLLLLAVFIAYRDIIRLRAPLP